MNGYELSNGIDNVQIGAPDLLITVKCGEFTATGAVTEILRLDLVAALKRIEWLEYEVRELKKKAEGK